MKLLEAAKEVEELVKVTRELAEASRLLYEFARMHGDILKPMEIQTMRGIKLPYLTVVCGASDAIDNARKVLKKHGMDIR